MTTVPDDEEPPAGERPAGSTSRTGGAGQISVGIVGPTGDRLAQGLEAQSPDLNVRRLETVPEDVSVLSIDCFVVDGTGGTDHHQTYDRIRERHASKPLVMVSSGHNSAVTMKLQSDDDAVHLSPTPDGIPYGLLSARCKDLADHAVVGVESEESDPATTVRTVEFYVLWGLAALTYGAGDLISTLAATMGAPRLTEQNPVVATVLAEVGVVGFVGLKTLVFIVAIAISANAVSANDRLSYYGPPLFVSAMGIGLTLWNLSLVL